MKRKRTRAAKRAPEPVKLKQYVVTPQGYIVTPRVAEHLDRLCKKLDAEARYGSIDTPPGRDR